MQAEEVRPKQTRELEALEAKWLEQSDCVPQQTLLYLSLKLKAHMKHLLKTDLERYKFIKLQLQYRDETEKIKLRKKIRKHFGAIGGTYNLGEVGKVLGFSRERVRQIEMAAKKKLRHPHTARTLAGLTHVLGDPHASYQQSY